MPKIDLFDPVSAIGHTHYNLSILRLCESIGEIVTIHLLDKDAFPLIQPSVRRNVYRANYNIFNLRLKDIIIHYKFVKLAKKRKNPHLFLSFNNTSMLLASILTFNKQPLNLIVHNNIQHNNSFLSKLSIRLLRFFNVKLILLEEIFSEYLISKLKYKPQQIAILYHPLPNIKISTPSTATTSKCVITYISGKYHKKGYDVFLKAVYDYFLNCTGQTLLEFKVLLNDKVNYEKLGIDEDIFHKNLVTFFTTLNDEDYLNLMATSSYICLPFRSDYNNSSSAVFLETLQINKPTIVSSLNLFQSFYIKHGKFGEIFPLEDYKALSKIFEKLAANYEKLEYPGIKHIKEDKNENILKSQLINILNLTKT